MNRDLIRRHILSKGCTLWGAWDVTQESSLEEAVEFCWKLYNELLEIEQDETDRVYTEGRNKPSWNGEALPFDTLKALTWDVT